MIKVDIISGFLGAGKTTLIKHLLKSVYAGENVVLIENEFGEIGIDGGFLKEAGIEELVATSGREKYIDCSMVDCDLYHILEGDTDAMQYYAGEYMREYSWAETRNAQLSAIWNQTYKM